MNRKAIIVGSAPISETIRDRDMQGYYSIALNRAWKLRDDFHAHVYLDGLPVEDRPPKQYRATSVSRAQFRRCVGNAGGPYLASMTAAAAAGYWAIANTGQRTISYFGCDMVYKGKIANHFYGHGGDKGPMMKNFIHNDNYPQKFTRLFVYGLFNHTLFLNGSGQEGTQLPFPIIKLGREFPALLMWVLKHPAGQQVLRQGMDAFLQEQTLRTEIFDERILVFNESEEAKEILEKIHEAWTPTVASMADLSKTVAAMVAQKSPDPTL